MKELTEISADTELREQYWSIPGDIVSNLALRVKLFLTGVIFPIITFLLMGTTPLGPAIEAPWQSGRWDHYLIVLISPPTVFYFIPILFLSILCLGAWCVRPEIFRFLPLRFGIYSGALYSGLFVVLLVPYAYFLPAISAVVVGGCMAFVVWIATLLARRVRKYSIAHLIGATTIAAVLFAFIANLEFDLEFILNIPFFIVVLICAASPVLCFVTYLRVSAAVRVAELNRIEHKDAEPASMSLLLMVLLPWIALTFVTWKFAINSMLYEYSRLPMSDPNCYVSSAAAHGHRRFVGSEVEDDSPSPVNLQMRRLKFLEFACAAASPRFHRVIRRIYNHAGPKLATQCRRSVWFADVTFVMLKPVESLSIGLQVLCSVPNSKIRRIYRRNPDTRIQQ